MIMHVQFNNKKQVSTWGLFLTLLFLIALGLLGGYYLIMEDRQQSVELALWGFLLLSVLVFYFGGFCYVEVDLSEQKLDVKYYRLFPIG